MLGGINNSLDSVNAKHHFSGEFSFETFNNWNYFVLKLMVAFFIALFYYMGEILLGSKGDTHTKARLINAAVN